MTQNGGPLYADTVAVAGVSGFIVSGDAGKIADGFDFSSDYSNSEKADKARSFVVKPADAVTDKKAVSWLYPHIQHIFTIIRCPVTGAVILRTGLYFR